ncbi:MAG: uroporphyrinogen-III synthase [Lachnospiraceae bacterium]|nr:uroporphyrinogen-III synthase [Lachnospiraceae bacterium]
MKEHILKEQVQKKPAESMRILIPRASAGNQTLVEELRQIRGIRIDDVPTYDTVCRAAGVINEREEIERGEVDYAVFTSASTVRGLRKS